MKNEHDRTAPELSAEEQARDSPAQHKTTGTGEQACITRPADDCVETGFKAGSGVKTDHERATGTNNNGVADGTPPPKKAPHPKPTFPEFLELAKQAISAIPSMTALRLLQKLLRTGVSAKSSLGPLINDLFVLLKDWPECSRLALHLSVQTRAKRSSDLIRGLRNQLTAHSRSVVGYPESPESAADQDQLTETVRAWLESYLKDGPDAGKDRKGGLPDVNWARWAAVCLMEEPLIVRTEGICRLLEALCPRHSIFDPGEAESLFFSEIGNLLGTDKPNARKIAAGLKLAAGVRSLGAATRGELRAARTTISRQNAQLDELDRKVKTLGETLADATTRITELEAQLLQKTQQVEQQKTERNLDREHLEVLAEQRLNRTVNDLSGRLGHEIAEAKICLDGDEPNVRMALDRLRQMEWVLAKRRGA